MRPFVVRMTGVAAAVALVGCRDSGGPPRVDQFNYAVFNADVTAGQTGQLTTTPIGYFFRAPALDLPQSQGDLEGCVLQRIVAPGSNLPLFIGAGDSVTFAVAGGSTVYLKSQTTNDVTSYEMSGTTKTVPVTTGAIATFTVPGVANGFPASSIAIKTAEPYQISTVPTDVPEGQPITVTWSPPGNPPTDSRMELAFVYATSQTSGLNEQLFCSLLDDGEYTVRSADLVGWRLSAGGLRKFTSRRWRSAFKDLGGSVMLALSSYSAPDQNSP